MSIPSNEKFGWAVRKQFDLHDPLHVAEMMRVARRYGDRSEIFSKVGWRVHTELSSTVTSEDERLKFEIKTSAGERVSGVQIIRGRS